MMHFRINRRFLAVVLSAVMTVAPVMSVSAEDGVSEPSVAAEVTEVVEPAPEVEEVPEVTPETPAAEETEEPSSDDASTEEAAEDKDQDDSQSTTDSDDSKDAQSEEAKEDASESKSEDRMTPEEILAFMAAQNPVTEDLNREEPNQPTAAISALTVVKNDGSPYGMFPCSNGVVTKEGASLHITFDTGSKSTYKCLYFGAETDENKSGYFTGSGSPLTFDFTVPASYENSWVRVAVGKSGSEWATTNILWLGIPSATSAPAEEEEPQATHNAPTAAIDSMTVLKEDGEGHSAYGMFPIGNVVCTKEGGKLKISFDTVGKKTFDRLYIGAVTDENKDNYFSGTVVGSDCHFDIELPESCENSWIPVAVGRSDKGTWSENYLWMGIPSATAGGDDSGSDDGDGPEGSATDLWGDTSLADGSYTTTAVCQNTSMFKIIACEITAKDGKAQALITLSGTGYDALFMGTKEEAAAASSDQIIPKVGEVTYTNDAGSEKTGYQFVIPFGKTDEVVNMAAHGVRDDVWYDRQIVFSSADIVKQDEPESSDNWGDTDLADGTYTTTVSSSASMFRIVDCVITSKDGKGQALITLSGTGYDYLFMGTAEGADTATEAQMIGKVGEVKYTDTDGTEKTGYQFIIPFEKTDADVQIAAHSSKNDKWYDRTIVFSGDNLTKKDAADDDKKDDDKKDDDKKEEDKKEDKTPEKESSYTSDTSGSTSAVNSSTNLADGVYTPDRFSFSGGTGKVQISCTKITVSGGQAFATLFFDSPYYTYVKANGRQYNTSVGGGGATVTIPVQLNANNTIIGMTTKMSVPHEITYAIFIYLAAADAAGNGDGSKLSNKALHEEAPQIAGLKALDNDEKAVEYAEYFKIFHYDKGITLLEIDMTRDTARDPELAGDKDQKAAKSEDVKEANEEDSEEVETPKDVDEKDDSSSDASDSESDEAVAASTEEVVAELYKGNIVSYLLVPEGAVVPAGLDKEMVIIQLPRENTYLAADEVVSSMEKLDLLKQVTSVAMDEKAAKEIFGDQEVTFAGPAENPDFKVLLKAKADLMIMPSALLPVESDEKDALSVEEQADRLFEITDRAAMMNIPLVVDRSMDEEKDLAKKEWIKVYGVLFGCEDEANALFAKEAKK
ncbi:MAG: hypothetical protein KBS83_06140 [Lachnospiraceae bacterium]|nr:hypothetical protein [Candidatus Equihabitans merdae]